jgi:hypothetical protein
VRVAFVPLSRCRRDVQTRGLGRRDDDARAEARHLDLDAGIAAILADGGAR